MRGEGAIWLAGIVVGSAAVAKEISEAAAIGFAIAAGLVGGLVASGWSKEPLDKIGVAVRMGASGMLAPTIVLLILLWRADWGEVTYHAMPVVASSGLAGIAAWPLADLIHKTLLLIKPREIYERVMGLFPGFRRGGDS